MMTFSAASATDVGNARASNQDAVYASERLCIVADGMGGHAGGEVAAQSAVSSVVHSFEMNPSAKGLLAGTKTANQEIFERAEEVEELHGMGTTLVAMALVPHRNGERVALINVGDSRAYLLEDGELERLTQDHSLVEEMLRQGEISQAEADVHPYRHVLTRAIGISDRVDVDAWTISPGHGARLLLCSDGLTNECSDEVIQETLLTNTNPGDAAYALIRRALDHGGSDNITVVVADLISDSPEPLVEPASKKPRSKPARKPQVATEPPPKMERPRPQNLSDHFVTFRVALFGFVLFLVLAGALGFTVWFNKATYFIGIDQNNVAIYNGRPGGLLWFKPTLVEKTSLTVNKVLPANLSLLRSGMLESSLAAANQTVSNLANEQAVIAAITATSNTGVSNG
jgi:protein phosphatase